MEKIPWKNYHTLGLSTAGQDRAITKTDSNSLRYDENGSSG
jgi:hypothetical protein